MRVVSAFHGGGPEIDPSTNVAARPAERCRASRRLVSGAIAFRSTHERVRASRSRLPGEVFGDALRSLRRNDREHDVGSRDDRAEVGQQLEPRLLGEPSGPLAPARNGRDDSRAAARERVRDRAPHRSRADDANGLHARRVYEDSRTERHLRACNSSFVRPRRRTSRGGRRAWPPRRVASRGIVSTHPARARPHRAPTRRTWGGASRRSARG